MAAFDDDRASESCLLDQSRNKVETNATDAAPDATKSNIMLLLTTALVVFLLFVVATIAVSSARAVDHVISHANASPISLSAHKQYAGANVTLRTPRSSAPNVIEQTPHPLPSLAQTSAAASPVLASFTIPNTMRARWPPTTTYLSEETSNNNASSPFDADTQRFKTVRGAIVSLFGIRQDVEFDPSFPANDANFFGPMKDDFDWIIFYTVFPENSKGDMMRSIDKWKWSKQSMDIQQRFHVDWDTSGADKWLTPHGATVYTWPVAINVPDWMSYENAAPLENGEWLKCNHQRWSFMWSQLTATLANQLLTHPLLTVGYDYWLKMDLDIEFTEKPPENIFHFMAKHECHVLHTKLMHGYPDCQYQSAEVFNKYAQEQHIIPLSQQHSWWSDNAYHFYGNFLGFSTAFAHSAEVKHLARYMWEEKQVAGYFRHRWTDQAVFIRMMGLFFDVSTDQLLGKQPAKHVCDLTEWRDKYFKHI